MSIDYRGNPWDMSGVNTGAMYTDSCVNTPSRCEDSCAAFDTTFPSTPAGYSIANPSGTTESGLGVRRCAAGYCGVASVTCGSGGTFDAPSGCTALESCTAFSTTCSNECEAAPLALCEKFPCLDLRCAHIAASFRC